MNRREAVNDLDLEVAGFGTCWGMILLILILISISTAFWRACSIVSPTPPTPPKRPTCAKRSHAGRVRGGTVFPRLPQYRSAPHHAASCHPAPGDGNTPHTDLFDRSPHRGGGCADCRAGSAAVSEYRGRDAGTGRGRDRVRRKLRLGSGENGDRTRSTIVQP